MTRIVLCCVAAIGFLACAMDAQQGQPAPGGVPKTAAPAPTAPPTQSQDLPKGTNTNPDAGLIAEFAKRVEAYVKLRDGAEKAAPNLERTNKPQEIVTAEKSIGHNVRAARASAKQGDLFTPATQAVFKRLLRPPLAKGTEAADNKAIIKDDAPQAKEVPFKINGEYPKNAPLSTVPPDVLQSLPQLPEDIQYRFVGRHLILYDAKANLIMDYMLNAMP
jgi:hypothetical protein